MTRVFVTSQLGVQSRSAIKVAIKKVRDYFPLFSLPPTPSKIYPHPVKNVKLKSREADTTKLEGASRYRQSYTRSHLIKSLNLSEPPTQLSQLYRLLSSPCSLASPRITFNAYVRRSGCIPPFLHIIHSILIIIASWPKTLFSIEIKRFSFFFFLC